MKWFYTVLCWLTAGIVFYGMFFKLAPYICTLVPAGQWQGLIKVGIYFIIAYGGGIGIPLILVFFSTIILLKSSEFDNF
ncbi:MAG: hypothetical protein LHV68_08740 [Elusimicrobia bacterium]|nr:hypothetical protein [Candidatus Liberimonas magnetica]